MAALANRAKDFLRVDLPIIQAPMAGVQTSALAIAVSNAGGMGSLPCAMLNPDALHEELSTIRAAATGPVNLNFFCHTPTPFDGQKAARWLDVLSAYYGEFRIDPPQPEPSGGRQPFSHDMADVIEPFNPPVISFHFGLPAPDLLNRVKSWGAIVLSSATTVAEAQWLEAHGADGIIAQGVEAGGHRGMFLTSDIETQLSLATLLPEILQAVKVPVIAAGGIADSHGVRAVLSSGALAAQIGTAFLLCTEATTSELHRAALRSKDALHTALTNVFTGRPARGIINRIVREIGPMNPNAPGFPLAANAIASLRKSAELNGSTDFTPLWCGQNPAGCRAISAARMTRELAADIENSN